MGNGFLGLRTYLMYRRKDRLEALKDLVYIECTSSAKYVGIPGAGPVEAEPPMILILDPNGRRLLNSHKRKFLETTKYTSEEIHASGDHKKEKVDSEFRLNRMTGSYLWKTRMKGEQQHMGKDQCGNCKPVKPGRKF